MDTEQLKASDVPEDATALFDFWINTGEDNWFHGDAAFDQAFRERFIANYDSAMSGELHHWLATPLGAFSLIILLDQFPRNAFRGTPRVFAADAFARDMADESIAAEHDLAFDLSIRGFFYMPFMHSENLADQDKSIELQKDLSWDWRRPAARHREIIRNFDRFPHRNRILGRTTTPEEKNYLETGGYGW